MIPVFPPRNLPSRAQPWGREVENKIRALYSGDQYITQTVQNDGRATGGTLAVMGEQVRELSQRVQRRVPVSDWTSSFSAPAGTSSHSETFPLVQLPNQGIREHRNAWLTISGFATGSLANNSLAYAFLYGTYLLSGSVSADKRIFTMLGGAGSVPAGWAGVTPSSVMSFILPPEGEDVFLTLQSNITVDNYGGSSTFTGGLEGISCYLTVGDKA